MRRPEWLATYTDGTQLREFMPDGSESRFHDIERSRLGRFALVCSSDVTVELDAITGQFFINGHMFLSNPVLNSITCLPERNYAGDLIQFKRGKVLINGSEISDEVLITANVGYKIVVDGKLYQFIVVYVYEDGSLWLETKITDLEREEVVHEDTYAIAKG